MKCLIIDDSGTMRKMYAKALADAGYNFDIVEAGDGSDGLAKLASEEVNLILVDAVMPGMGGVEFSKKVKSHPKYKSIPMIMITGNKDEAQGHAADVLLIKPFKPDDLKAQLTKLGL